MKKYCENRKKPVSTDATHDPKKGVPPHVRVAEIASWVSTIDIIITMNICNKL